MAHVTKIGERYTVAHGKGVVGAHETEEAALQHACDLDGQERKLLHATEVEKDGSRKVLKIIKPTAVAKAVKAAAKDEKKAEDKKAE